MFQSESGVSGVTEVSGFACASMGNPATTVIHTVVSGAGYLPDTSRELAIEWTRTLPAPLPPRDLEAELGRKIEPLEMALHVAKAHDVAVFPLNSSWLPFQAGGFKAASKDPREIRRLFMDPGAYHVGIATGEVSGIDVLDIDPRNGGHLWFEEHAHLFPATTPCYRTGRGGLHLWFRHLPGLRCSNGTTTSGIAPGVDIKADGGLVKFWPSVGYTPIVKLVPPHELPEWPEAFHVQVLRMAEQGRAEADGEFSPNDRERVQALAPPSLEGLETLLAGTPNPERFGREGYLAMCLGTGECAAGLIALLADNDPDRATKHLAIRERVRAAFVEWAVRWDHPKRGTPETEAAKWEIEERRASYKAGSGWPVVLRAARDCGADTSRWRPTAEDEFTAETPAGEDLLAQFERLQRQPESPKWIRPEIPFSRVNIDRAVDAAEAALIGAELDVFVRGDTVMKVGEVERTERRDQDAMTGVPTIRKKFSVRRMVKVEPGYLQLLMNRSAKFTQYSKEEKAWVEVLCPDEVARKYLVKNGLEWKLPHLRALVSGPTLRPDGTLVQTEGYDARSELLLDFRSVVFPTIPDRPTREDAEQALKVLTDLLAEFPFVDGVDRSVALSAIITACVRTALPTAPMHAITATKIGSGKSFLIDLVFRIAAGEASAGITWTKDERENEKLLDTALLQGDPVILIDNVTTVLRGAKLSTMLTQERVNARILGMSKTVNVPTSAFVMGNGNNMKVDADITRRALMGRLDAEMELPQEREFRMDPVSMVAADRGKYVAAALTIVRAYLVAGRPVNLRPLGSFEEWSKSVRSALVWLGQPDPVLSQEFMRADDPERQQRIAFRAMWAAHFGDAKVTTAQIIGAALSNDMEFRDLLRNIAGDGDRINSRRLGTYVADLQGNRENGLWIERGKLRDGNQTWVLRGIEAAVAGGHLDLDGERARLSEADARAGHFTAEDAPGIGEVKKANPLCDLFPKGRTIN